MDLNHVREFRHDSQQTTDTASQGNASPVVVKNNFHATKKEHNYQRFNLDQDQFSPYYVNSKHEIDHDNYNV